MSVHDSLCAAANAWQAYSLGRCQIVLSTVVMGSSLCNSWRASRGTRDAKRGGQPAITSSSALRVNRGTASPASLTFIAAACVLRLAILPALTLPLHLALCRVGFLPADPALLMILTISAGMPSSQTLVMVLNANGATDLAEELSKIYVPMYLLAVLSVAALIFVCCIAVETVLPPA